MLFPTWISVRCNIVVSSAQAHDWDRKFFSASRKISLGLWVVCVVYIRQICAALLLTHLSIRYQQRHTSSNMDWWCLVFCCIGRNFTNFLTCVFAKRLLGGFEEGTNPSSNSSLSSGEYLSRVGAPSHATFEL